MKDTVPASVFLTTRPAGTLSSYIFEAMTSYQDFFQSIALFSQNEGLELRAKFKHQGGSPSQLRDKLMQLNDDALTAQILGFGLAANIYGTMNSRKGTVRSGKEGKFTESVTGLLNTAHRLYETLKADTNIAVLVCSSIRPPPASLNSVRLRSLPIRSYRTRACQCLAEMANVVSHLQAPGLAAAVIPRTLEKFERTG